MNKPAINNIELKECFWGLAYAITRTNDVTKEANNKLDPEHLSLEGKIWEAWNNTMYNPTYTQSFTEGERIRMRRYILSYCERLAINWENHPAMPLLATLLKELEMVSIYKMSMSIYTSFSSI